MKELTSLEILSNIEGAASSEAVEQLFDTLRKVGTERKIDLLPGSAIPVEDLREDRAVEASTAEKQLIIANFPSRKDNYLVVPKVMEE